MSMGSRLPQLNVGKRSSSVMPCQRLSWSRFPRTRDMATRSPSNERVIIEPRPVQGDPCHQLIGRLAACNRPCRLTRLGSPPPSCGGRPDGPASAAFGIATVARLRSHRPRPPSHGDHGVADCAGSEDPLIELVPEGRYRHSGRAPRRWADSRGDRTASLRVSNIAERVELQPRPAFPGFETTRSHFIVDDPQTCRHLCSGNDIVDFHISVH